MPWSLLLIGAALLGWSKRRPRRNIDAFVGKGGVVHPIRESKDYDPVVEELHGVAKHDRERADHYRDMRSDRHGRLGGGVDRPPWAVGYTDAQLERIARDHGQRASQEAWWQSANLVKGSGELRRLLREGGYREEKARKGAIAPRGTTDHSKRRYVPPKALPF